MKTTALVLALLLSGAADELATTTVSALTLKAPAAWKRTENEGTTRFAAPSGEAFFEVDVGQVQREGGMPAEECLQKILGALGPDGFTRLTVGNKPAAVKVTVDTDESGKQFRSQLYVGCDGRTTWSLMFNLVEAKKDRFAPLADKVAKSIEYKGR